jgi:phage gp29-like protein
VVAKLVPIARPEDRRPPPAPRAWADVVDDRWSVARVRAALTDLTQGQFAAPAILADAILQDDRVAADLRTRVLAVSGLPFRIEASVFGDQRRARAVAREAELAWSQIAPASLVHDLLRWSILVGFAPAGCAWTTTARRWTPTATLFHPEHLYLDTAAEVIRATTRDGLAEVTPGSGAWVLHAPDGSRPWMTAALRGLAIPWLARQYARRDWSRFSEKHGLPIVGAIVPQDADSAEKDGFYSDLRRLGSEGLVMLPRDDQGRGFDLKYLEPGNVAAASSFRDLISHCDQAIAVALLGQASNAQEGGSFAKAQALDAIRLDLLESDAKALGETIYAQLLRPWAHYNFGDADLAPRPVWDPTPPSDIATLAATHKTAGEAMAAWNAAAATAGLAVDVAALAERYGVPLLRASTPEAPVAPQEAPAGEGEALIAGVDLRPPQGVREAFRRGLDLVDEGYGGDGLQPETIAWARRLARGEDVAPEKAVKMRAWFARHESSPGEAEARRTDKRSPAWVAWLLWGGDAGRDWAGKIVRQLEARGVLDASTTLSAGQDYADAVIERGTASGTRAMRGTLGAIANAIDAATSPEDLRARLLAILSTDDPAALAAALTRAQTLASLAGRYDVIEDL